METPEHIWHAVRPVLFIALFIYAGITVLVTIFQSCLVYFPTREIIATPDNAGLSYETVRFRSEDGVNLSGWYVPAPNAYKTILFCHGNGGNISHRIETLKIFHRLGLSTFLFDYRGFGESEGSPDEEGTYRDAEAAWKYLTETLHISPSQIIIVGRSLGGPIAANLAQSRQSKGLIIESSFTSAPDIGRKFFPFLPVKLIARFYYSTDKYLKEVKCPILVVHSSNDDLIPFEHGKSLFESAPEPKQFLEISGSHNNGFFTSGKVYKDGIREFISGLRDK